MDTQQQQQRKKGGLFFGKHGQSIAPSDSTPSAIVPDFDSNLMSSLNLEVPSASVLSSSSPSSFSHHYFQHGISPKFVMKGSFLSRSPKFSHRTEEQDEWDFDQYSKRASIRSDPGDRKRDGLSSALSHSPKHVTNPVPVQKSPSAATGLYRTGRLHDTLPRSKGESNKDSSPRLPGGPFKASSRLTTRRSGGGITKQNISAPTGPPTHKKPNMLLKGVTVRGIFTFKYSGGEGEEAGYHRQMSATVDVRVHQSLFFDEFHVSPADG